MHLSNLNLEIHLVLLGLLILLVFVVGYVIGRIGAKKSNQRVLEVENDMLLAHEEVLKYAEQNRKLTEALEKAKSQLKTQNISVMDESKDEKNRKFPLGKIG